MQNKKNLFSTEHFNVVDVDGKQGIEPITLSIVSMPFEKDPSGLPKCIGILREYNQLRPGKYSTTLITGRAEGEDPDLLATAMRETKEESGYDVSDPDRWYYLGPMTTSKLVLGECMCFACDVTGLTKEEKVGDGSESEKKSEFKMVSIKEALASDDCYIPTVFMRMFRFVFNKEMAANAEEEKGDPYENLRKRIDIKYLNYDGIESSSVKHDANSGYYIEYIAKEITPDAQTIPAEINGVKIVVTLNDNPDATNTEKTNDRPE